MAASAPRPVELEHYFTVCLDELLTDYGEGRAEEVALLTRVSLDQLKGSIAAESLPEMVTRLVRVRLGPRRPA